jgi:peptide/nickel transport system permease protein
VLLSILRRLLVLCASLAVSTVLVFAFMQVLPGDPARVALGVGASDEAVAALRHEYGLDRPLPAQYLSWVGGLLRGDLGTSYVTSVPIGPQIADRLLVTLWLAGAGMSIAILLALPLGTLSAVQHRSPVGLAVSAVSQVGRGRPRLPRGHHADHAVRGAAALVPGQRLDARRRPTPPASCASSPCRRCRSGSSRARC